MALTPLKTFVTEILTPADLNAEFLNIYNNPYSLVSPFTSNVIFNDTVKLFFGTGSDASISYDGTNLYIDPDEVGTGNIILNGARMLLLNDTTNANMVVGLTIQQGVNDDQILALKSSDVATVLTSGTTVVDVETDDFLTISKTVGAQGGATIQVMMENVANLPNLRFDAYGGQATTTPSTAAESLVQFFITEHDGANALVNASADDLLFGIRGQIGGSARTLFLLDADGDLHVDGSATVSTFDAWDDLGLVRAFDVSRSDRIIRSKWDEFVKYKSNDLKRAGILSDPDTGDPLVNITQLQRLHNGAIWQIGTRVMGVEERLDQVERKLLEA